MTITYELQDRLNPAQFRTLGEFSNTYGLHKFRYTYGRVLDEGKTPIEDIRVALGHKDISTTIGYLGGGDKNQRRANIERSFPKTA